MYEYGEGWVWDNLGGVRGPSGLLSKCSLSTLLTDCVKSRCQYELRWP